MKKFVIINFDDQYINTSKIICDSLNMVLKAIIGKTAPEIVIDDILCELDKPLDELVRNVLDEYGIVETEAIIDMMEIQIEDLFVNRSCLVNGVQEFINECYKHDCKVVVISNKNIKVVNQVVNKYTPYLGVKVESYKEDSEVLKLIQKIEQEHNVDENELLIISHTDFGNEFLDVYEYSKEYCGDYIFEDYVDLLPLIDGEKISMPTISCSLDIEVEDKYFQEVVNVISECAFEIDVTEIKNSNKKLLVINRVEKEASSSEEGEMYAEKLMEDVLHLFFNKKKELKRIQNECGCEMSLSVVVNMDSTKVNPCISPSMKVVKFCGETNIDIDYDVYSR